MDKNDVQEYFDRFGKMPTAEDMVKYKELYPISDTPVKVVDIKNENLPTSNYIGPTYNLPLHKTSNKRLVLIWCLIFGVSLVVVFGITRSYTWEPSHDEEMEVVVQDNPVLKDMPPAGLLQILGLPEDVVLKDIDKNISGVSLCVKDEDWNDCINTLAENYNYLCINAPSNRMTHDCPHQAEVIEEMRKNAHTGKCSHAYYHGDCVVNSGDFYGLVLLHFTKQVSNNHQAQCWFGFIGECKP